MTKKSTKDFFKRYALSQEFKTKTVPNNSFREDGVQDRFVDLLLHNENNFLTDFLHNHLDKLNDSQWLEVYKDYNKLLENKPDGVVIVVQRPLVTKIVKEALKRNINVLSEKPPVYSVKDYNECLKILYKILLENFAIVINLKLIKNK